MKRIKLVVISTILAHNCLAAGWNQHAWPSTNKVRIAATNYLQVTNIYAKFWQMNVSVTNSTITGSGSDTILGWSSNKWVYTDADSMWAAVGVGTNTATNWFSLTNTTEYLTEIELDNTNLLSFSNTNYSTNTYLIPYANYTSQVTEIQQDIGVGVRTNMTLNVKEIRAWDVSRALEERRGINNDPAQAHPKYYRYERENIVNFKTYITDDMSVGVWINTNFVTNGTFIGYLEGAGAFPTHTIEELLNSVSAPSNYFEYTPWRQLNGSGIGYGHIMTSSFTIAASGTNVVTNTVIDYCGDAHTISGTNDQVTNIVCTNINVAAGFTQLDYGWKYIDSIINELVWTTIDKDMVASSNKYYGLTFDGTNWIHAQGLAEAAYSNQATTTTFAQKRSFGSFGAGYFAEIESSTAAATFNEYAYTGIAHQAELYTESENVGGAPAGVTEFDANGFNLVLDTWTVFDDIADSYQQKDEIVIGNTAFPVWCSEPVTNSFKRGFFLDVDNILWLLKWDGTNGLTYSAN